MTLKVSNASLIRELAAKTWRANRKRNLLTIFAIFLTTLLIYFNFARLVLHLA